MAIAVGVLFTLDNLEIIDARDYLQFWPAALVAIGAAEAVARERATATAGSAACSSRRSAPGCCSSEDRLLPHRRARLLAAVPGLLRRLHGVAGFRRQAARRAASTATTGSAGWRSWAASSRRSNSQTFDGADLTAVMGGCEIDLRQASIAPGTEAVIDVFAFWGGIEIKVPEDWTVVIRVDAR